MKAMNVMKTIGAWFADRAAERKTRRQRRHDRQLWEDAQQRIQVREFDDRVYICMDNVPLLDTDILDNFAADVVEILTDARANYVSYQNRQSAKLWNNK